MAASTAEFSRFSEVDFEQTRPQIDGYFFLLLLLLFLKISLSIDCTHDASCLGFLLSRRGKCGAVKHKEGGGKEEEDGKSPSPLLTFSSQTLLICEFRPHQRYNGGDRGLRSTFARRPSQTVHFYVFFVMFFVVGKMLTLTCV